MTWAPLQHLQPELMKFHSTAEAVAWACEDPVGLKAIRYLREAIEMALRLRTEDSRVTYISSSDKRDMAMLLNTDAKALYESLRALNNQIAIFGLDDWMALGDGPNSIWAPLASIGSDLADCSTTHQFAKYLAASTNSAKLQDGREVLEAVVRLKCDDPRMNHLTSAERQLLARFVNEPANDLVRSLSLTNREIGRRNLAERTDVTAIVTSFMAPP